MFLHFQRRICCNDSASSIHSSTCLWFVAQSYQHLLKKHTLKQYLSKDFTFLLRFFLDTGYHQMKQN